MKKYNYEEYEEDEHMVSNWEPIPFSIKDNYDYMCNNLILIIISNLLIFPIAIILIILDKILFGFKIFNSEKINHDEGFVSISNHIHYLDCSMIGLLYFPRRVHYPTLETNFKIPFIRHLIKLLYAMPIPNNSKQKKEFYKSINSISSSVSFLVVFFFLPSMELRTCSASSFCSMISSSSASL